MKPKFRSRFEKKMYDLLRKRHINADYEAAKFRYTLDCVYNPDWRIENEDSSGYIYLETKGNFKASERRKILAVLKAHPGLDLRMVFQKNNKISKVSKTTYGSWCDKHGVRWTIFPNLPL